MNINPKEKTENIELKTKSVSRYKRLIIRYKRMIIQLVVIICGFVLAITAIFRFDDTQRDLMVSTISIVAGIIAAAFISLMDFIFTKKDEDEELIETVNELKDLKVKLESIDSGLKGVVVYKNRLEVKFEDRIKICQQKICIYVTNLGFLTNYFNELIKAAEKGVSIEILGMKPTNLFIATRYHELGKDDANSFFDEIKAHIKHLREILMQANIDPQLIANRFKVRLYISQPTYMLFRFDNQLIISFILRQGRARDQIHIEFDMNDIDISIKAKDFITHYNLIWNENEENTLALTLQGIDQLPKTYNLNNLEAQGKSKINKYSLKECKSKKNDI